MDNLEKSIEKEVASRQGLTLVHFSAQNERFVWHRGCIQGLFERVCRA